MMISLVVATSEDNAIGINNTLPWRLPDDLKFFKRTTLGKPIIMGRKTFESLGKPLPGRLNIVLTSNEDLLLPAGVRHVTSLSDAIALAKETGAEEACIIGGGEIFRQTLTDADHIYLTRVHTTVPGADTFFPVLDHTHWKLVWQEKHLADAQHFCDFTFERYERIDL
jgi:dihydrofolate reductase